MHMPTCLHIEDVLQISMVSFENFMVMPFLNPSHYHSHWIIIVDSQNFPAFFNTFLPKTANRGEKTPERKFYCPEISRSWSRKQGCLALILMLIWCTGVLPGRLDLPNAALLLWRL